MMASVARGVAAGLVAGIPQVLVVQLIEKLLGLPPDKADIGPRFVERSANHLGTSLPSPARWLLSALFHFAYSAWWGAVYGLAAGVRRVPTLPAAALLGGVIWTAAFSPIGAGTQTGTERQPRHRNWRDHTLHVTAALSFSLVAAYTYGLLRGADLEDASIGSSAASRPEPEPVRAW
jgi:hypothetical protein